MGLYSSGGNHKPTAEACLQHTDGDQAPAVTGSLLGEGDSKMKRSSNDEIISSHQMRKVFGVKAKNLRRQLATWGCFTRSFI